MIDVMAARQQLEELKLTVAHLEKCIDVMDRAERRDVGEEWVSCSFFSERCQFSDMYRSTKADIYQEYIQWAEEYGIEPMSHKAFSRNIKMLGVKDFRTGKHHYWQGIQINENRF